MTRPGGLVVVRHGQTAWNATGRFQGQADPPLNGTGRQQARDAADALAPLRPRLLVASDLRRAGQTADILGGRFGVPVTADPRLREIDLGCWTGLSRPQAAERFPEEYARWAAGAEVRRGGGETPAEAGIRAAAALVDALDAVGSDGTGVVVAHGLVLRSAIRYLVDLGILERLGEVPHLGNGEWLALRPARG